jgi:2-polyprenyl-3-methyl-5-hydroxy-6-metoxy-1,4-benzoquinol methylase
MQLETIACNLCGGEKSERLFVKGGLPVARCCQCGLVYANPRLTQTEIWRRYSPAYFWDEYMPAHHAADGQYLPAIHRRRSLPMLNLLQPYRKLNTLLEVGCAAGFFLKVASEENWQVTGVEIMQPAVAYARQTLGLNVHKGTLTDVALPAAGFDAVVMIETVEHLLDPLQTASAACSLVRPGGVLLVTVPNYNSAMRHLLGTAWSVLSPAEHLYYFTESTLVRLLRKAGFSRARAIWSRSEQIHHPLNAHNTHEPHTWRSRLVKAIVHGPGRFLGPLAIKSRRADQLIVLAIK